MSSGGSDEFNHALHTANIWLSDTASALGSRDRRYGQRVLRTWLHTLRDRLTVEAASKFGQQLPELLRGAYYDGWRPHRVPMKYSADQYVQRFAVEAGVDASDVPTIAATVSEVIADHMSPGQLAETLAGLSADLRTTITGSPTTSGATTAAAGVLPADERITTLEDKVGGLTEAVRTLAHGLEDGHFTESGSDRARVGRAARLADEILVATGARVIPQ